MVYRFLESLDINQPPVKAIMPNPNTMVREEYGEVDLTSLREYHNIILNDSSYKWLIDNLHRELSLSVAGPDIMVLIRQNILGAIPTPKQMSPKIPPEAQTVIYTVDWDISAFFEYQKYEVPKAQALAGAITITGSSVDAQALSCQDYLTQTWPSTGLRMLKILQASLNTNQEGKSIGKTICHT